MPLYCLHCLDRTEGGAEARARARAAHLAWAGALGSLVRMAGPLLDEAGTMVGSVFLIEADSLDQAKAIHAQDPYVTGDVFGHVHIHETRWAIGEGKPE
ncbi:MAG: YciI family protein [Hyphomonas sp.]|nr:hypothetical protein [Hyphomonas sp.]MCB9970976.1 hypothetical protein [Hyphomonas sp.]